MASRLWENRLWIGGALGAIGLAHMFSPWQVGVVSGASMEPSFHSHQVILIDRHHYRRQPVRRGDVVIVREDDGILIKRVYALAGDTFWTLHNADDGHLYREIVEPAMLPRMQRLIPMMPTYRLSTYKVPPGKVYLVGDNTSASIDSRHFGPVSISSIMGRVRNAPRPMRPLAYAAEPMQRERAGGTNSVSQASIK